MSVGIFYVTLNKTLNIILFKKTNEADITRLDESYLKIKGSY